MTAPRRRRVGQHILEFRRIDETHGIAMQAVEWNDGELTVEPIPMRWMGCGWVRDVEAGQ